MTNEKAMWAQVENIVQLKALQLKGARHGKVRYPGTGISAEVMIRGGDGTRMNLRANIVGMRERPPSIDDGWLHDEIRECAFPSKYDRVRGGTSELSNLFCAYNDHVHRRENTKRVIGRLLELDEGGVLLSARHAILDDVKSGAAFVKYDEHQFKLAFKILRKAIQGALDEGAAASAIEKVVNEELVRSVAQS